MLADTLERWRFPGWTGYALGVAVALAGLGARVALAPLVGESVPYAFFAPTLLLTPLLAGWGPALAGYGVMLVGAWLFILPPDEALAHRVAASAVIAAVGLLTAAVTTTLRRAVLDARDARREAETLRGRAEAHRREAESQREEAERLGREMNHRVKNLFAVILSIVRLEGREATDAGELAAAIRARVFALSRAHSVGLSGAGARDVDLAAVIGAVLGPFDGRGAQLVLRGPSATVDASKVTPLGLFVNELAARSARQGALSSGRGRVEVDWSLETGEGPPRVTLDWRERADGWRGRADETMSTTAGPGDGYGEALLASAVQQLGGAFEERPQPGGLDARLAFEIGERRGDR